MTTDCAQRRGLITTAATTTGDAGTPCAFANLINMVQITGRYRITVKTHDGVREICPLIRFNPGRQAAP